MHKQSTVVIFDFSISLYQHFETAIKVKGLNIQSEQ